MLCLRVLTKVALGSLSWVWGEYQFPSNDAGDYLSIECLDGFRLRMSRYFPSALST